MREFKYPSVLNHLQSLLFWQKLLLLIWCGSALLGHAHFSLSGVLGVMVVALSTWIQKIFFRRLPEELGAKAFFNALIAVEILKWLLIIGLTTLLQLNAELHALAFLWGFISAYLTYFLLWLKG